MDPVFKIKPSKNDIERFKKEAKILAQFSHPYIPAIYDVDFDSQNSRFSIIFEWIDGTNLNKYLRSNGALTIAKTQSFLKCIVSALKDAHAKGIAHRDIKPANIIITPDSTSCYLVDFGIALTSEDLLQITGSTTIGTPGYMPQSRKLVKTLQRRLTYSRLESYCMNVWQV